MLGSVVTGFLILVFGYAYPAYECFKAVEKNKPEIDQLRFWCKYWILVALLVIIETFSDLFISWLPFYYEAKLGLYVYLWLPKTQGTIYIYNNIIRPYISSNETDIDRTILELRTRTSDSVIVFLREFIVFGQAKFFEIMNYVVSHSKTRPVDDAQLGREEEYLRRTEKLPSMVSTRKHKSGTKQKLRRGQPISNSNDNSDSSDKNDSSESDNETTTVGINKRSSKSKKTDD
ncbi:HVA22-like protein h [Zostera marina]|uniref:HVA22-like protein n=1 Tax=Zostera marina TaxID=29655 RepID=A0A0K9NP84_ZOSMR|nr:HVA22-like protein h [Zostera marina]